MSREILESERELILKELARMEFKIEREFLRIETRLGEVEEFSKSAGRAAGFKSGTLSTSIGGLAFLVVEIIRQLQ